MKHFFGDILLKNKIHYFVILFNILYITTSTTVSAAIPAAAKDDPRYALGYLVVTHYPGVSNNGSGDSTAGLQQAIDDAHENELAVFFPSGTYIISDSLKCYKWQPWSSKTNRPAQADQRMHALIGSTKGTNRPVIKLSTQAKKFDNADSPRPLLVYNNFEARNSNATQETQPSHPLGEPANYRFKVANLFKVQLRGIDFDVNGHVGAIGVAMTAAQTTAMIDVRVKATGGYAGFMGLPGRNSGATNIEVEGGRFGIILTEGGAGTIITGAKLYRQTESALSSNDFVPLTMTGFHIIKNAGPVITLNGLANRTTYGTMSLIDGKIELSKGGLAIDNTRGKSIYLRNVFVKGSDQLIHSGKQAVITASGDWSRIKEYTYTDQRSPADLNYVKGEGLFRTFSLINGTNSQTPEPISQVQNSTAPPSDLISRHVIASIPSFEDQNTIIITEAPYNATPDDGTDDRAAIQAAIDAAETAGHGQVFIPKGNFHISDTLILKSNTRLHGVGYQISSISTHSSWKPTSGFPVLLRTVDAANAQTYLGFITLYAHATVGGIDSNGAQVSDRFNHLHWRAGANSSTMALHFSAEWTPPNTLTHPRRVVEFTNNGGGRHYFLQPNSRARHVDYRSMLIRGTRQPLWFYGLNAEAGKKGDTPLTAIEITDAANIRIFNMKREGRAPSVTLNNAQNVGVFSSGAMRTPTRPGLGGYFIVKGNSQNVLMANLQTQSIQELPNGEAMLSESLTGKPTNEITWPDGISIYKRGDLDDAAMLPRQNPPPPTGGNNQAPTAKIGSRVPDANIPEKYIFSGVTSTDPDGMISAYAWELGDGTQANTPRVYHTYSQAGTYTVTLTVTDDKGATGTTRRSITIPAN